MNRDHTETIVERSGATIKIVALPGGNRSITIDSPGPRISEKDKYIETAYSLDLIKSFLNVKGPFALNDEIRREEDPLYVKACLEYDIKAYIAEKHFTNKRILDFGCGAGASSIILARMFPETEIVGIDLVDQLVSLARQRAQFYHYDNVSFLGSPDTETLPPDIGTFDYILLSAVYEHLLPQEREALLRQLWSLLHPGGVFFLNQTPYRFFPFEGHTTRLLFMNYLPPTVARWVACKYSKRVRKSETWEDLLRRGIRGGSPREILTILKKVDKTSRPELLKPGQLGCHDRIDVWYSGYAVSIAHKYPKIVPIQKALRGIAKIFYTITGIVILPTVSLAIRKRQDNMH